MKKGWELKKIGDVCDIFNGGTPDTKDPKYWGGDILWITPKDMGQLKGIYVDDTTRKITDAGLRNSSAKILPTNSIILSSRAPIGHLAINIKEITTNQGCRGIVPKKGLSTLYLYYYLKNSVDLLNSLGTGTTFKELSSSKLADVEIPVPPLAEQQRIVSVLDEAFASIAQSKSNAERNLVNVQKLFDSYVSNIFVKPSEEWEEKKLGDKSIIEIIDSDRGVNYPKKSDFYSEGYCLFMNTKNVRPDGFDFTTTMFITEKKDKALGKGKLSRNDVVMTTRGTIGNLGVYNNEVPFERIRTNSGMLIFRPNLKHIVPEYLFEVLRSGIIKAQIKKHVSGAAQPQLPIKTLVNFSFPLPKSISEQRAIVERLEALQAQTRQLESIYKQKTQAFDELKKSLLAQAFSGEL